MMPGDENGRNIYRAFKNHTTCFSVCHTVDVNRFMAVRSNCRFIFLCDSLCMQQLLFIARIRCPQDHDRRDLYVLSNERSSRHDGAEEIIHSLLCSFILDINRIDSRKQKTCHVHTADDYFLCLLYSVAAVNSFPTSSAISQRRVQLNREMRQWIMMM